MEKNAFRRMDYYIEALQDLFEPISGFEGFGESPEEITIQDLESFRDCLNAFPEAARPLLREIQEKPPFVEETPTILAYLWREIRGQHIPPGFWDWEKGPLDLFRKRFRHLQPAAGFEDLCSEISFGLYSLVVNFQHLYRDLEETLPEQSKVNPIQAAFPNCFAPVEAAADTPPAGRAATVSAPPPEASHQGPAQPTGSGPALPPAAAGSRGYIYIPTSYSRAQLELLYRGLVEGGFVEAGKEEDFLLCFDPEADRQGGFVWTATGEKNRKEIVIQALCDLLDLLGVEFDYYGGFVEALCINIPTFTKSAKRKAGRGFSRYHGELKEILKSIQNQ